MDVDGKDCMPPFSNPPYRSHCLIRGLAATSERYRDVVGILLESSLWPTPRSPCQQAEPTVNALAYSVE
jgi:hypothetical protein